MAKASLGGRSVTTTLKLEALAARERPVVRVVSDAHWFLPFLQAVLPAALGRGIDWNQRPSGETDILVETPLRSHDCAGDVHELCFRLLISGEPYSLATLTGYDLIVETKDDEAARPSDTAFLDVPFCVTFLAGVLVVRNPVWTKEILSPGCPCFTGMRGLGSDTDWAVLP